MAAAIGIGTDFAVEDLRRLARASGDVSQVRRRLVRAAVLGGDPRMDAARLGGVTRRIVRDRILRFNAEGPEGPIDRKAPGKPSPLTPTQRTALAAAVEAGPKPCPRRRCPPAACRPRTMVVERVSRLGGRDDSQPGTPRTRLRRARGAAAGIWAGPAGR